MEFDLESLTLAELSDIEKQAGHDAVDRLMAGKVSASAMQAVVWVVQRRADPSFTWEKAGEVKVVELTPAPEDPPVDAA